MIAIGYAGPTFAIDILLRNRNPTLQLRNGTALFAAYKTINFTGLTGNVQIDTNGGRLMLASLQNFVADSNWNHIGDFNTSSGHLQLTSNPFWSSESYVKPWGQAEVIDCTECKTDSYQIDLYIPYSCILLTMNPAQQLLALCVLSCDSLLEL